MPVFESSRKVQVMGSSLAMTLPSMFAKASEIEKGSLVNVVYDLGGVLVVSRCEDGEVIERLKGILKSIDEKVKNYRVDLGDEGF